VTKLLLLGGAAMAAGAGLGALGAWSLQPFNLTGGGSSRWEDGQFETTVLTAAPWAALAFMLGASAAPCSGARCPRWRPPPPGWGHCWW
jgi:hypothetical protein